MKRLGEIEKETRNFLKTLDVKLIEKRRRVGVQESTSQKCTLVTSKLAHWAIEESALLQPLCCCLLKKSKGGIMTWTKPFLLATLSVLITIPAFGQGVLVPHHHHHHWPLPRPIVRPRPQPPVSYKIKEISVRSRIQDQVARTQVTQSFVNTGSRQMEVSFVFPLPYDGAIDRLTFMVDGKEYDAQLMTREDARRIYEGYVRRNKDPALLEWIGTGMFKTSVFPIPPGQERTVTLRYTQLLRKDENLTDFLFPLSTAKYTSHAIEKLSFDISIESSAKIKSVYSPTHAVEIKRDDDKHAVVSLKVENQIPSTDFRLFFDTSESQVGASVVSYWPEGEPNGYFLLLASPQITSDASTQQRKNTIFVIDRSGSMNGKKIEQAKEALRFVVNNLREGDLFNIIAYDSDVESFEPELQRYNEETRKQALGFVNGIFAGGGTNIDAALKTAMSMIQDGTQPNYIVFLTDGKPTVGETNEARIVDNARKNNRHSARLVSFGVGYDVNSRLIDRLSRANRGQSEYVRPDEDIETHVSRLYRKISAPVMVDATIKIDLDASTAEQGSPTNRVYPKQVHDIFAGQQVVLVGRYNTSGAAKITIAGSVNGETKTFHFPAEFASKSGNESYAFVEKIWASRRIGEIIDQLDLEGQNQELVKELVALSIQHGIITPYTSFLADDQASPGDLANVRRHRERTELFLERLSEADTAAGFRQRRSKKSLQDAAQLPTAQTSNRQIAGGRGVAGGVLIQSIDSGEESISDAVVNVGKETIYRRGKTLIVSNARDVDLEKDKDQIVEIERYSDEYFTLVAANSKSENAVLARQAEDQEMIIRLRGKVYRIK